MKSYIITTFSNYNLKKVVYFLKSLLWLSIVTVISAGLLYISELIFSGSIVSTNKEFWSSFLSSISSGLIGAVCTVVALEGYKSYKILKLEKQDIIFKLRSDDPSTVASAIQILKSTKRLSNGFLDNLNLKGINLSGIDIENVRMRGAKLDGANLTGTVLYNGDLRYTSIADAKVSDKTNFFSCKFSNVKISGIDRSLLIQVGAKL